MKKLLYLVEKPLFIGVFAGFGLFWAPTMGAAEEAVTLTRAECAPLLRTAPVAARPAPGVAYQPGVDVRGNKVAGADAAGSPSPIKVPDEITFSIATDLQEKYGIGSKGVFSGEGTVGKVIVRGGQVFWNEQPLDGGDQALVRAACERAYGGKQGGE